MSTALDIVTRAMRLAGVYQKGEVPDADEAQDGLDALNTMLASWSIEKLFVYYIVEESLTLTANQGSYTMGPSGDLNTTRPTFIDDSCRITLDNMDYGLKKIDHDAWSAIVAKTTVNSNIPMYIFADMQNPLVTLKFWPEPSQTATAVICSWKQLQNFSTLTTELALPPGYKRAIEYSLAEEFGPEFDVEVPTQVMRIAGKARKNIKRLNAVTPVAVVETGYMGRRFAGNIYADLPN